MGRRGFETYAPALVPVMAGMLATAAMADDARQTLVLAAPRANDAYYAPHYDAILDFQAGYAAAIIEAGLDDIVVLVDDDAFDALADDLPAGVLIRGALDDIWARDLSPVLPARPYQFRYAAAAQDGDQRAADAAQQTFNAVLARLGISLAGSDLVLDGGNFVDDGKGRAVVTDRFLEDNDLTEAEAIEILKEMVGLDQVTIVPADDPDGLAHADGMVMFSGDGALFVNRYDGAFRDAVLHPLRRAFPDLDIVEVPTGAAGADFDDNYASSCGIYVNGTVTDRAIYLPVFGDRLDSEVLALIEANTEKAVIPIRSDGVCFMGGSARCTVWQTTGEIAATLRQAAGN